MRKAAVRETPTQHETPQTTFPSAVPSLCSMQDPRAKEPLRERDRSKYTGGLASAPTWVHVLSGEEVSDMFRFGGKMGSGASFLKCWVVGGCCST
jgi:hypothetical protein